MFYSSVARALCVVVLLCGMWSAEALIRKDFQGSMNAGMRAPARMATTSATDEPAEQWFSQLVDHFTDGATDKFQQKYYVQDSYYTPGQGAPIFLVLGGEGPLSTRYVGDAFITDEWAQLLGAAVVAIEHRYYGDSYPNKKGDLTYLTAEQALADTNSFIQHVVKDILDDDSPIVVFGGSYSGALSAWMKQTYPYHVNGSFASSAPVLAKYNYYEYFEVFAHAVGDACSDDIALAVQYVESLLTQGDVDSYQTLFNSCTEPDPSTGVGMAMAMEAISDTLAGVVQYNNDASSGMTIPKMCAALNGTSADSTGKTAAKALGALIIELNGEDTCLEVSYDQYIQDLQEDGAMRSWTYQTCTEFAYFQTGDSAAQPFSKAIDIDFFYQICVDAFPQTTLPDNCGVDITNDHFGALNILQTAQNTYFGDGTVDPWHALAAVPNTSDIYAVGYKEVGTDSVTVLIEGTSHCADMYSALSTDPEGLTEARNIAFDYISQWVGASN